MVNWQGFTPSNFEYDFERDKLSVHGVTFNEAIECFFSEFEVRRNKRYKDRYQLIGKTTGGRRLKIIFQLKPKRVVRIITGWPV
ncbi:MAG: hypothetical protein K9N10_08775 [Deltaproteobacteria bacterium]|nr:hypothetical protein [Deltaproteobacteria bacterium]